LQTRWPTVSRGGAYCGGHLAAQLVLKLTACIHDNGDGAPKFT